MYFSDDSEPITPPATPLSKRAPTRLKPLATPATSSYPSPTSSSSKSTSSRRESFPITTSIRENVQVMVRCRPRSEKELLTDEQPCWIFSPENGCIESTLISSSTNPRTFCFDNIFTGVDNSEVYQVGVSDLVRSAMKGYNGTVFAYGQTASGKTYTMTGNDKEPGVIPRAVNDLFSYIEEDTGGREYLLRVSYMEIYNETIKDLLNTKNSSAEVVEDKRGVYVRNLKEAIVKSPKEILSYIKEGESNRHISSTDYNDRSSRSHTILQIIIESRSKAGGTVSMTDGIVRVSQLNLIDLAGSERVASNVDRRKEGAYINKSLLHLGNVISKLTSQKPSKHIPFRDSKLTRILQTSLSGNARIAIICTINPTDASRNESLNTLRFAMRAKLIKTAAKMTRAVNNSELQNCLITIAQLQTKMQEKTDSEAETRERLKNLLSLILTSSKPNNGKQQPSDDESEPMQSDASGDNLLLNDASLYDVVARCEEGFNKHKEEVDKMQQNLEAMQDVVNVMEAAQKIQAEAIAKRDAQIDKLKQELNLAKPISTQRASHSPLSSRTSMYNKKAIKPITIDDLTPAITAAAAQITNAIVSGLRDKNQIDCFSEDILKSIQTVFTEAVFSGLSGAKTEITHDTSLITDTISKAIESSPVDDLAEEMVERTLPISQPAFIPIYEAVSFIQPHEINNLMATSELEDFEWMDVPELEEYEEVDEEECVEYIPGLTSETTLYESIEISSVVEHSFSIDESIVIVSEDATTLTEKSIVDEKEFYIADRLPHLQTKEIEFENQIVQTNNEVYIMYKQGLILPRLLPIVFRFFLTLAVLYFMLIL